MVNQPFGRKTDMTDKVLLQLTEALSKGKNGELYTIIDGDDAGSKAFFARDVAEFSDEGLEDFFRKLHNSHPKHGTRLSSEYGDIFCEVVKPLPRLCICGGGHVSLALSRVCALLGFAVTVIDEREEFANKQRFPEADQIYCCDFGTGLERFHGGDNDYFVIVTRGHSQDRFCLERILQGHYAYCGMIGSRTKTQILFEDMLKHGYTKEQLDSVYTPIGLMIGAETPAEIAVAIAGEIVQVKASFGSDSAWDKDMLEAVAHLDRPAALAVIIQRIGSTPRGAGARMLVYDDGSIVGTVGGGKSEAEAMEMAGNVIRGGAAGMYHCSMDNKEASTLGLICGGEIDVFIEKISD